MESTSCGPKQLHRAQDLWQCIAPFTDNSFCCLFPVDDDGKQRNLQNFCSGFLTGVQHPTEHFQKLDHHLSTLLPSLFSRSPGQYETERKLEALPFVGDILNKLPSLPQRNFALPLQSTNPNLRDLDHHDTIWDRLAGSRWPRRFLLPEAPDALFQEAPRDTSRLLVYLETMQDAAWSNMYVTSMIDRNNFALACRMATLGSRMDLVFASQFAKYVDTLSELLDIFGYLDNTATFCLPYIEEDVFEEPLRSALIPSNPGNHKQSRAVIKAFLWTVWQRSVMLSFHYVLGVQLAYGYNADYSNLLAVRGIMRLSELGFEDIRDTRIESLCNWSFGLLSTGRASLCLDFRTLWRRYKDCLGEESPGRCGPAGGTCVYDQPETCRRFTDSETKQQSFHVSPCEGACETVIWDEASYRKHSGIVPRAVLLSNPSYLEYCVAGQNTLAISHVWSHGQGGRPETGLNACLHERYCALAERFGCTSYWIDAACVPEDPQLRKEAIGTISDVFANSKLALISDIDLQQIKLSRNRPIEELETLLSVLLVCDWNVRAWTMLEAVRSSKSLGILCRGDTIIMVADLLREVHSRGAMDLAVLVGNAQHLLPSTNPQANKSIEEAGFLLSRRHASWAEDEVTCWALLVGHTFRRDSHALWNQTAVVSTGYLLSSTPRLTGVEGRSWAPSGPYVRQQRRAIALAGGDSQDENSAELWSVRLVDVNASNDDIGTIQRYTVRYPSYDGHGSYQAQVTQAGIFGKWLYSDIESYQDFEPCRENCYLMDGLLDDQTGRYYLENPDLPSDTLIFPQPDMLYACRLMSSLLEKDMLIRVLRPLSIDGTTPWSGGSGRGEDFGQVCAICASQDHGSTWRWEGVYQWMWTDDLFGWKIGEMLIV